MKKSCGSWRKKLLIRRREALFIAAYRKGSLRLRHFREVTVFAGLAAADLTFTDLVGQHGVVARTGSPELITRYQMTDVNEYKGNTEHTGDDGKKIEELRHNVGTLGLQR